MTLNAEAVHSSIPIPSSSPIASSDVSTSSSQQKPLCAQCKSQAGIYTCPRCKTRTCSVGCSQIHKQQTSCSGVRNKAEYVPMDSYGWGSMMDDYAFLEEVGRKIGEWGKEIVKGGYRKHLGATYGAGVGVGVNGRNPMGMSHRMRGGHGRMRGRGKYSVPQSRNSKRDYLKMRLEEMNIDMELLSVGMERRMHNHSVWDSKSRKPFLTIEFVFHPQPNLLQPSQPLDPPFRVLTHKNDISSSLLSLLQSSLKSKKDANIPAWVKALAVPEPSNEAGESSSWTPPHCVMQARVNPMSIIRQHERQQQYHQARLASYLSSSLLYAASHYKSQVPPSTSPSAASSTHAPGLPSKPKTQQQYDAGQSRSTSHHPTAATLSTSRTGVGSSTGVKRKATPRVYYRLDPTQPLSTSLQHTHFVEYPTVEVWEEFKGMIVDPQADSGWSAMKFLSTEDGDEGPGHDRPVKRRKVASRAGKKTIAGLLGGYGTGSDGDGDAGGEKDGLALLGNYGGSESEAESNGGDEGQGNSVGDRTQNGMDEDIEDSDEEPELDPAAVLELMKKVRGDDRWFTALQNQDDGDGDEEAVDWGDDDEDEDAAV